MGQRARSCTAAASTRYHPLNRWFRGWMVRQVLNSFRWQPTASRGTRHHEEFGCCPFSCWGWSFLTAPSFLALDKKWSELSVIIIQVSGLITQRLSCGIGSFLVGKWSRIVEAMVRTSPTTWMIFAMGSQEVVILLWRYTIIVFPWLYQNDRHCWDQRWETMHCFSTRSCVNVW